MNSFREREHIFKLVFQLPFYEDMDTNSVFNYYVIDNEIEDLEIKERINNSFKGVVQNIEQIDKYIENRLNNWKISRVNKENLAIIRLAVYQLIYKIFEPKNIINESVELSKIYGEEGKHGFVNAILRNILEDINKNLEENE